MWELWVTSAIVIGALIALIFKGARALRAGSKGAESDPGCTYGHCHLGTDGCLCQDHGRAETGSATECARPGQRGDWA